MANVLQSRAFSRELGEDESFDITVVENTSFSDVTLQLQAYGSPNYDISALFGDREVSIASAVTDTRRSFQFTTGAGQFGANANPHQGQLGGAIGFRITNQVAGIRQFRGVLTWSITGAR